MTISSTTVKNSYSANSSTTAFAYTFKIFADTDLQVIIRSSTGTETTKTLTTHYTVSGAGDASGGNVTFTSIYTPFKLNFLYLRVQPLSPSVRVVESIKLSFCIAGDSLA